MFNFIACPDLSGKHRAAGKLKFLFTIILFASTLGFSQGWMHSGNFNPDSLKPISVSGKIIADSSMMNGMYYLDINNDNTPDYMLHLGPVWYKPDSISTLRPKVGDNVTISGGLYDGMFSIPMIVVDSINGSFWRSGLDSFWNNMGTHSMMGGMNNNMMNYSFGFNHDSLHSVSLTGKVMIDTTFMYYHYYLDVNSDGVPDYFLNFGPPWYQSSSNASLPANGQAISIKGGMLSTGFMKMVIVYQLNGTTWMDPSQVGNHLGGGWIHSGMMQAQKFNDPFDSTSWMSVNPGWHQSGMMGGGMMPDSLYCQILAAFPQDFPDVSGQSAFAGYEIGVFNPDGTNNMMQSGKMGGQMSFNSQTNFQLHFNNMQTAGFNVNVNNLKVKYWNNQNNSWVTVSNSVINTSNNTVTFSQSLLSSYVILTADKATTGIAKDKNLLPENFSVKQNYPNPFNPSTTIEFTINENSNVNLSIYNLLGQKITTLINQPMSAGAHSVQFNASNLSSGIYFYHIAIHSNKLDAGENSKVMKMELLK